MSFLGTLWLPILLSAVFAFVLSFVMHMILTYHRSDFSKVPNEDAVMEALRKFDIPTGDYMIPCAGSPKAMQDPAFIEKMKRGPVAIMTLCKGAAPSMTKSLILWFIYIVIVNIFAAYIASHAVPVGGSYLEVFRFVGCTAFMGHSLALLHDSIWFQRKWSSTLKSMFDGLVYALVTAGTFGWLWPR